VNDVLQNRLGRLVWLGQRADEGAKVAVREDRGSELGGLRVAHMRNFVSRPLRALRVYFYSRHPASLRSFLGELQ
jgi:hypothetical protein